MGEKFLFLTAGFGDLNQIQAAERLLMQAKKSNYFSKCEMVKFENLPDIAPNVFRKYRNYLGSHHKGFGYFCWKPEIINSALRGIFGEFDGVVWADAGCEIVTNPIARIRMKKLKKYSIKHGVFCFKLNYPESDYTKRSLFEEFPDLIFPDSSPQIQATWIVLHGSIGRAISERWTEVSLNNIKNLDLRTGPECETKTFVEHRFDQSILSLVIKSFKLPVSCYTPISGKDSILSQLKGMSHPIWTSRNRSGVSIKKKAFRFFL
jgi:hypothetical protein